MILQLSVALSEVCAKRRLHWKKSRQQIRHDTGLHPNPASCDLSELLSLSHLISANKDKKLPGAKGIATRSKDATWGSWPYY